MSKNKEYQELLEDTIKDCDRDREQAAFYLVQLTDKMKSLIAPDDINKIGQIVVKLSEVQQRSNEQRIKVLQLMQKHLSSTEEEILDEDYIYEVLDGEGV